MHKSIQHPILQIHTSPWLLGQGGRDVVMISVSWQGHREHAGWLIGGREGAADRTFLDLISVLVALTTWCRFQRWPPPPPPFLIILLEVRVVITIALKIANPLSNDFCCWFFFSWRASRTFGLRSNKAKEKRSLVLNGKIACLCI